MFQFIFSSHPCNELGEELKQRSGGSGERDPGHSKTRLHLFVIFLCSGPPQNDNYSLFKQMLENCLSTSNSKLISGPSINMHEERDGLKPPQENDLIISNYREWAEGLRGRKRAQVYTIAFYSGNSISRLFFWELLLILEREGRSNSFDKHYSWAFAPD